MSSPFLNVKIFSDSQVEKFSSSVIENFSSSSKSHTGTVGHYTQLVWGETTRIGCGFVMYLDVNPKKADTPYRQVIF